jgi:hypothetical protein
MALHVKPYGAAQAAQKWTLLKIYEEKKKAWELEHPGETYPRPVPGSDSRKRCLCIFQIFIPFSSFFRVNS